ncbi:hypothetical protein [uncultured Enterovirga sp.]|uniref:hypothetical protein n=1 Tax=uncultured Enterovirga sp. TaxID=2026352 RepID=UPI0035CC176C
MTGGHRPAGWTYGLPALALLCGLTGLHLVPAIEQAIRRSTIRLADPGAGEAGLARYRARAQVDGRDVTLVADLGLTGDVRSLSETAIRSLPGVRSVRTEVAAPVAMTPFAMTIRRSEGGFSFAGGVSSAEDRAALVEQAGTLVSAEAVDDRLKLATGAPPGFEAAARFLLDVLSRATSGEASISDRSLRVRAVTPDFASYRATLAAVNSPPAGFAVEAITIEPPVVPSYSWSARRDEGGIRFGGFVPSETLRAELVQSARAALPDVAVTDDMQTAGGLESGVDFRAFTGSIVAALAELQAGTAELAEQRFRFSGQGVDKLRLGAIETRIRQSIPAGIEAGPIAIVAVAASPFRVVARRSGGRVVLTGFVPGERERREVAALVSARYPGERLNDQRVVADGAPAGFPEAQRAALEALADFAEGEAVIRDTDLRLSGRILYGQLAARARDAVPKSVPPGWSASIVVEPVAPERSLDAMTCADVLAEAARRDPVRFQPGKAELSPQSRAALDGLADIVRRCGTARIAVAHRLDGVADGRALATARATTLVSALVERGATARLTAAGSASAAGAPATATAAGAGQPPASAGERTEFAVSP